MDYMLAMMKEEKTITIHNKNSKIILQSWLYMRFAASQCWVVVMHICKQKNPVRILLKHMDKTVSAARV